MSKSEFHQHPNLDVLRNGELAWDGALVRFSWSVDNDLLCGGHIGRDQDARIHLGLDGHSSLSLPLMLCIHPEV